MQHLEIYGPYKRKHTPWRQRIAIALGYVIVASFALLLAWVALLWMLDLYLSTGIEQPINLGTQHNL
jgi:cell division septal protein FtsQ